MFKPIYIYMDLSMSPARHEVGSGEISWRSRRSPRPPTSLPAWMSHENDVEVNLLATVEITTRLLQYYW